MRWLARFTAAILTLSSILAFLPGLAFADDPLEGLAAMPPVGVAITQDGLDSQGHWTQTIRLTIQPGGSLSDASMLVYGDAGHVDELFADAKKARPNLPSPALIPAGLQLAVPIDPTKTYALQSVLKNGSETVWSYTNGVIATAYAHPRGSLTRVIAFPDGKPTDLFIYPGANGPIQARPGGKIVDLTYVPGESFSDVVSQVYGLTNYNAAADFAGQTHWSPTAWPPKPGETKEVVIKPRAVYEQQAPAVPPLANPNPVGHARQLAQLHAREQVGIVPVRLESFGTVYHVAVSDPQLTATGVSTLLYGTPDHASQIAQAAGLNDSKTGASAPNFDPHLFGRAFDVSVDYLDEGFILSRQVDPNGVLTIGLVDGATITDYPPARSGPLRVVRYPTGYKRVYYRPPQTLLTVARGLSLFHVASAPWLTQPDANTVAQDYAAQLIWAWAPGIPRSSGDLADSLQLKNAPGATYLEVLVSPGPPPSLLESVLTSIVFRNPFVAVALLLVVACAIVVLMGLARRSVGIFTQPRW